MQGGEREQACAALPVPAAVSREIEAYLWAQLDAGRSGATVYRLHGKDGAPDLYLKHGRDAAADEVADEMARLRWLADHVPVPAIIQFARSADETWLLTSALPGRTAYRVLQANSEASGEVVDAVASFLRRLHAVPVDACPFDGGAALRLARARARIDAGLVDTDDFDDERRGWTAEQVWQALNRLPPFATDPVVSHGDFSLDNLLMAGGEVAGCIDVGWAGVADRHQDLAILWNGLGEFGPTLQARLFERYGIDRLDPVKLNFHLLLDEFF